MVGALIKLILKELINIAKNKNKLSHIYPKDKRALSLLGRSGAMSRETFNKLEISNNRLKTFKQANLIKQVSIADRHGNGTKTYYELTNKGQQFCQKEMGIRHFISNGHACTHNAKVSEYLANNLSKRECETVLSERELKPFIEDRLNEYLERHEEERYQELLDSLRQGKLSMPDIIYKTEQGTYLAIEVTTDSYGNAEIDAKLETCELLNIEVQFVHT